MSVSDIIATIGLAISVLGIPITFILARRTRQRPELRYALDFDRILSPDSNLFDRGLYMTLGANRIDSISRTRIALWNHRGDTIRNGDILDTDPLRVQLKDGDEALQARVLGTSRKQLEVHATIDSAKPSSVQIDFNFLDVGDGALIEIIHRGPSEPTVLGTLQGADVRNVGPAVLGSKMLEVAAAYKSRMRRFFSSTPKEDLIVPAALICGSIAFFLLIITESPYQPNHLIDVNHYKLNTVTGQVAFAQAVAKTEAFNSSPFNSIIAITFIVIIVVAFLGGCLAAFRLVRRKVPWSVVSYQIPIEKVEHGSTTASLIVDTETTANLVDVPRPCQNGRKTAVTSGHPWTT
jgi:hypothetical protein